MLQRPGRLRTCEDACAHIFNLLLLLFLFPEQAAQRVYGRGRGSGGILASYQDKALGSLGHMGAFSFHHTKNITSGFGGALLINDDKYIDGDESRVLVLVGMTNTIFGLSMTS